MQAKFIVIVSGRRTMFVCKIFLYCSNISETELKKNNDSYLLTGKSEDKWKDCFPIHSSFKIFDKECCIFKTFTESDYRVGFCENVQEKVKKSMNLHHLRQFCKHQV